MAKSKPKHSNDLYGDVEKIKAALVEAGYDLKDRATQVFTDSVDDLKDRSATMKEHVENYTTERPLKSLGIVFFVGLVFGFFFRK